METFYTFKPNQCILAVTTKYEVTKYHQKTPMEFSVALVDTPLVIFSVAVPLNGDCAVTNGRVLGRAGRGRPVRTRARSSTCASAGGRWEFTRTELTNFVNAPHPHLMAFYTARSGDKVVFCE